MKESASWTSNLTTFEARQGKEQLLTYEIPRPDTTEHLSTQLLCYQDIERFKECFSMAHLDLIDRESISNLTEWTAVPAGMIAEIQ